MISLGFEFENVMLNIYMANLWKSDNPVNKVSVLKKLPGLFLNPFMHNVVKWPNILQKSCGVHTARYKKLK